MNLADAIFSKNLIQIGDHRITQLLAIHCDCSEQYNMKQFSLTRLQKCTQSPFEIEYTRTFASVFIGAKSKRNKKFCCSVTLQKNRKFCAQGAHTK